MQASVARVTGGAFTNALLNGGHPLAYPATFRVLPGGGESLFNRPLGRMAVQRERAALTTAAGALTDAIRGRGVYVDLVPNLETAKDEPLSRADYDKIRWASTDMAFVSPSVYTDAVAEVRKGLGVDAEEDGLDIEPGLLGRYLAWRIHQGPIMMTRDEVDMYSAAWRTVFDAGMLQVLAGNRFTGQGLLSALFMRGARNGRTHMTNAAVMLVSPQRWIEEDGSIHDQLMRAGTLERYLSDMDPRALDNFVAQAFDYVERKRKSIALHEQDGGPTAHYQRPYNEVRDRLVTLVQGIIEKVRSQPGLADSFEFTLRTAAPRLFINV